MMADTCTCESMADSAKVVLSRSVDQVGQAD